MSIKTCILDSEIQVGRIHVMGMFTAVIWKLMSVCNKPNTQLHLMFSQMYKPQRTTCFIAGKMNARYYYRLFVIHLPPLICLRNQARPRGLCWNVVVIGPGRSYNYFSVNYVKETPLLPLFVINIGYIRQLEQRSVLSDNDRAVDRNLATAHVLLDFNSAQRKEFWSVCRLVCYN